MMATPKEILEQAITLKPVEKAELVDYLISSLHEPDKELDKLWAQEAESRLAAYKRGELKTISLEEALAKYK